ncbi:MAG: hypothetical protein MI785_14990 [Kiloniellales bacterium]|nr:hypothetical protein [Kiloniellales bacterium]
MSATSQCPQSDLHFDIRHVRMEDSNIHYLEVKARCKICGSPMVFRGLPLRVSPEQPTGELGGYEARLPMLGEGEEPSGSLIGFVGPVVRAQ